MRFVISLILERLVIRLHRINRPGFVLPRFPGCRVIPPGLKPL
jgi:hypothetical protein